MRLPRNLLSGLDAERYSAEAEQRVQSNPGDKKQEKANVTKSRAQWHGRNAIGLAIAGTVPPCVKRTMVLKNETHRPGHGSRNRRRRPDHRRGFSRIADELRERTSGSRNKHKKHVAPGAKAAGKRGTEWDKPSEVQPDV